MNYRTLLCILIAALAQLVEVRYLTAQEKLFANEPSVIRTYGFYGEGKCKPFVQGPRQPTKFNWTNGQVTGFFSKAGTYHDTASFDVWYSSGRCGQSGIQTITAVAVVHSDSVIRMLPRSLAGSAIADSMRGGWTTTLQQTINHKIAPTSSFSQWKIDIDSTLEATLELRHKGESVNTVMLSAYETGVELEYILHFKRGPTYFNKSYTSSIAVRVRNSLEDSIYTTPVEINVIAPAWQPAFGFSTDTLRLTSTTGVMTSATLGLKLDGRTASYELRSLNGTISSSANEIEPGDSGVVSVFGETRTRGRYLERLKVNAEIYDHNGDLRKDSDLVLIELTVAGDPGPRYWEGTDGSFTRAEHLAMGRNGTIYAAGDKIFSSTDDGRRWTPIPTADQAIEALCVSDKGTIFIIGDQRYVRSSTDVGVSWQTAQLGYRIYYPSNVFVLFQNYRLLGAGDLVLSSGRGSYFDNYYERWEYPQHNSVTTDEGLNWKSEHWSGSYYEASAIARDSSYNHITSSNRQVTHSGTNRRSDFTDVVRALAIDGFGAFYTLTDDGLYVSTDIGYSWQRRGLIFDSVAGFAVAADGEIFVLSKSDGVYHSTDGGSEWATINEGLGKLPLTSLTLKAGGKVFVGTRGGGVYRSITDTKLAGSMSVETDNASLAHIRQVGGARYLIAPDDAQIIASDMLGRALTLPSTQDGYRVPDEAVILRVSNGRQSQTLKLAHR